MFRNGLDGNSHGVETTADVRPAPWWRVTGSYSYLRVSVSPKPGSTDVSQEARYEGGAPHHQVQLGTSLDLPGRWSVDWLFRYISRLRQPVVPAYGASDVRVAWEVRPGVEASVVGQDLFQDHHLEWPSGSGPSVEIGPSVYARVTWMP